jgi:release factor glutamine methyltransferase
MVPAEPQSIELEGWTIERVLTWAAEDFGRRGIGSPRLDAELLLGHVLHVDRIRLILDRDLTLRPDQLAHFRELIKRRRAGEPIAYIRGTREFYGLPFQVDRRVLIPRPDTEPLVEVALVRTRGRDLFGRALDLGTGSGCVAIALARERPTWLVTGVDLDPAALGVARDNAVRLGAVPGVRFLAGDLFAAVPEGEPFDLVVANPPYVPAAEYDKLQRTIRDYEPRLALHGGTDGLDVVRRIEIGFDQGDAVSGLFERAGLEAIERARDYGGHERVVSGRMPS